ncbi:MAG: hypothetical protein KIG52_04575 [Muribaculaceae bacterium]|nr:hypothetical protein [Muribaculaceae bacterium]MDD6019022.1 hypothetical protein [bacterium]MDD6027102.1 hypothetical protein [bacterium]
MKRTLSVLLVIMVSIATAVTLRAETDESKPLSAKQWQRAIAIVGQNAALDGRYGHPESEFPEEYMLDDLNKVYKSSKWKKVYEYLKSKETEGGNIEKIREIAKEYTQPAGVVRKLKEYIASHPESASNTPPASPASAPVDSEVPATQPVNTATIDAAPEEEMPATDSIAIINATAGGSTSESHGGWAMVLDVILLLMSAAALYFAWITKKENAELKKELDYKTNKLNSQFEKFSKNITTDLNRVTYLVNRRRPTDIDFDGGEKDGTEVAYNGPKRLFLTKPDANDYFIRTTEVVEIGNSIFELSTNDGVTGTFKVIDNPEVHQFALMMPTENLVRACTGKGIQISNGKTRIVTDREGTARLENGRWHVAVKAIIHYEA